MTFFYFAVSVLSLCNQPDERCKCTVMYMLGLIQRTIISGDVSQINALLDQPLPVDTPPSGNQHGSGHMTVYCDISCNGSMMRNLLW